MNAAPARSTLDPGRHREQAPVHPAAAQPSPAKRPPDVVARGAVRGTPRKMRVLAVVVAAVAVGFGLAGGQAFRIASESLGRADANAEQLRRAQDIQIALVRADAEATNAFLVGGLEPPEQRAQYRAALDEVGVLVAQAAAAQPADAEALSVLNETVLRYAGGVEQARANNRQNLQVGAQYLRASSESLRSEALPVIGAVAEANDDRVALELHAAEEAADWLLVAGGVALAICMGSLVWLATRSHRYVNVPLAVATGTIALALIAGLVVFHDVRNDVRSVREGPLARSLAVGDARVAAFDARANESLTLVSRGSGAGFEDAWRHAAETVEDRSEGDLLDAWQAYAGEHDLIRELDDGGDWEGAVASATSAGGATEAFAWYARISDEVLAEATEQTSAGLTAPRTGLALAGAVALALGAIAALAGWRGVGQRLGEYP